MTRRVDSKRIIGLVLAILLGGIAVNLRGRGNAREFELDTAGESGAAPHQDAYSPRTTAIPADSDSGTEESPADSSRTDEVPEVDDEEDGYFGRRDRPDQLRISVRNEEGRPLEGRRVKFFERWGSHRIRHWVARTRADGVAALCLVTPEWLDSLEPGHELFVELSDFLLPAPESKVTHETLGASGPILIEPPSGRFEVRSALGLTPYEYGFAHVHVFEESPGGTKPDDGRIISDEENSNYRFAWDMTWKDLIGDASTEKGGPVVFKESHFGRTYRISLHADSSVVAEKRGVVGPASIDDVVAVELTAADLTEGWHALEFVDSSGLPVSERSFRVFDERGDGYCRRVRTDAAGRALVERGKVDSEARAMFDDQDTVGSVGLRTWFILEASSSEMEGLLPDTLLKGAPTRITLVDLQSLVSGRALSSDGRPLKSVALEVRGRNRESDRSPPMMCRCGLAQGTSIRTDEDGRFEFASNCGHEGIEFRFQDETDFIRREFSVLPQEDIILTAQRRTLVKGTIVLGESGRLHFPMSLIVLQKDEQGRDVEQSTSVENETRLDVVSWTLRIDHRRPTTIALRADVPWEEVARSREFTPNGETIEIPPFDMSERLSISHVRVLDQSRRPLQRIKVQVGDGWADWTSLESTPPGSGWFEFLRIDGGQRLVIDADGYPDVIVRFVEGATVVLELLNKER